jgi:cytochrome c553
MNQAVAPCESCHGEGHSADKLFPLLAGQHADFLANQLWVLRSGVRTDAATYEPMSAIAHMLSAADIDAVSAYYASLAPRPKSSTTAALPSQTVH